MPPPDDARVPDLPELRRRATAGRAAITQVQLGRNDRAVTYESKDGTDVLEDPGLQQAAADLKITAVEKAVAAIEGDRSVGIDFAQKTAIGPYQRDLPAWAADTLSAAAYLGPWGRRVWDTACGAGIGHGVK
jgi:hypothetical protein